MDYDFTPEWDDDWFTEFDYSVSDGFDEDYEDAIEEWEDRCGYDPQYAGVCWHVGTEDCSFFCPFHHIHFTSIDSDGDVSPKQPFDDLPF